MAKVQISIDSSLLARMDNYAKANYMSRSGFISMVVNQYLLQSDLLCLMGDMRSAMDKISRTGTLDADAQAAMDKFIAYADLLCVGNRPYSDLCPHVTP